MPAAVSCAAQVPMPPVVVQVVLSVAPQ